MTNTNWSKVWNRIEQKIIPEPNSGCWLWEGAITHAGYGLISVNNVRQYVHRLSYSIHCDAIPDGMFVMHKCDNPLCCNPYHLMIGSNQDNVNDMVRKKRNCYGERQGNSKLKSNDVIEIIKSNLPLKELSQKYGVSIVAICQAKKGRRWKHLQEIAYDAKLEAAYDKYSDA